MRRSTPGLQTIRDATGELRASLRDGRQFASVILWTREQALKEPVESPRRQLWVAFNRGFVSGTQMWSSWKRRRLRDLPDEARDDARYRTGLAAGEFLAPVMHALATNLRHSDLSNVGALVHFAIHYGGSMTREILAADNDRLPVLQWIRDSETLLRAHAAATHDAESHCYGVGERIELAFLRALATRTRVPLPSDAEALIAERRRDATNLPTGVDWSQLPEAAVIGGPLDGASEISVDAAKVLRDRVRWVEWTVILDMRGNGARADRGILAGLTAAGHVPLLAPQGTDPIYYQGCLGGSLDAALIRSRGKIHVDLMRAGYAYARVLASPRAQALLSEPLPDGLLKADALARHIVRQKQVGRLEDADALAFFNWLAEQAGVAVTPAVLERREHFVVHSINRAPEEPPGPLGGPRAD